MTGPTIGVVQLANRPLTLPGSLGDPATFGRVSYETATGAWVDRVVAGDPALASAYAQAAVRLERAGADAIIANCGFAIVYQEAMAEAVRVPVASSSLLLLPLLLRQVPSSGSVVVLSYEAGALDDRHYDAAGVGRADRARIRAVGIEGSDSWRALGRPEPTIDVPTLERDLRLAMGGTGETGRAGAVLVECSAFCIVRDWIRSMLPVPMADFVTLGRTLLLQVAGGG
jgi:hypothetical protein